MLFYFVDPEGWEKLLAQELLAQVINCENPTNHSTACNECNSCQGFKKSASFNIFELDAASHNSVEHIRTLNDQVRFQPQQGTHKVFIIDEVHMLSASAFNAFLKTLEEPPPHAIFILATTEKHKIIPTILSRCQIFDFKRIQIGDMVKQMKFISEKENITVEEEALHVIASKADGALRDALSMYDRILSSSENNTLSYKDVIRNLNILDYEVFFKAVDACIQEDLPGIYLLFNEVLKRGFDPSHFALGLASHLRNLLFSKNQQTITILETTAELQKKYAQQAHLCTKQFLINGLSILNEADVSYQRAIDKRLHIEIALTRLCYIHRVFEIASVDPQKKTIVEADTVEFQKKTTPKLTSKKEETRHSEPQIEEDKIIKPAKDSNSEVQLAELVAKNGNLSNKGIQNTPSINQIDQLLSLAKEKVNAMKKLDIPFTVEKVQEIWDDYIKKLESPSARNMLSRTILSTQEKSLIVKVGTQVAKETILQEAPLFQEIRDKMHLPDMDLKIEIDSNLFPDQEQIIPKKYLSAKEKYDLMHETNPLINKLVSTLDLKLEND